MVGKRVERYLASLPAGLDSHLRCETKASLLHSALEGQDAEAVAALLPERVATVARDLPPAGVWVPAVYNDVIFHAVCELAYPDERSMMAWCYERAKSLARKSIYRRLLRAAGPARLFRLAAAAHRLFQRGTELKATVREDGVTLRVTFPFRLHDEINSLSNVPAIIALAELTGGENVEAALIDYGDLHAIYECTWASRSASARA